MQEINKSKISMSLIMLHQKMGYEIKLGEYDIACSVSQGDLLVQLWFSCVPVTYLVVNAEYWSSLGMAVVGTEPFSFLFSLMHLYDKPELCLPSPPDSNVQNLFIDSFPQVLDLVQVVP
jgi:hypothetical protein